MRKHKETEQEAVERRKKMYGYNGKCCDRIIDPENRRRAIFYMRRYRYLRRNKNRRVYRRNWSSTVFIITPVAFVVAIVALILFCP